jgi:hypothetical protein
VFSTVVGIDVFSMIGRQYAWHCSKRTGSGNDLSSFTITVHAISVTQISTSASGAASVAPAKIVPIVSLLVPLFLTG